MAGRVEEVTALAGVQIEEDTRHNNDLLAQALVEEVQTIVDRSRKGAEIQPKVEGRVGHILVGDVEAHLPEAANDVVTLHPEVSLQSAHLMADLGGLQHLDGSLLEGHVGATVQVRTARADGLDELLGADNPSNTPARQTEALGQTVNNENIVLININNIVRRRNDGSIAVRRVVVAAYVTMVRKKAKGPLSSAAYSRIRP